MNLRLAFLLGLALVSDPGCARSQTNQTPPPLPSGGQILSSNHFDGWTGLNVLASSSESILQSTQPAIFRYPDGAKGWIKHGFRLTNDGTADWHNAKALKFDLCLADDRPIQLNAYIATPNETEQANMVQASVTIRGAGWHYVTLPWSTFTFDHANTTFLQYVKELRLAVAPIGGAKSAQVTLKNIAVVDGDPLAVYCDIRGKSTMPGQTVEYVVNVKNCSDLPQSVTLSFIQHGWEAMTASVQPDALDLQPGESKPCQVQVSVPDRVAPGGHEEQVLQAVGNGSGDNPAIVRLITARALPHPTILHTPEAWAQIREQVKNYAWAQKAQADYITEADKWNPPEIAQPPHNDPDDTMGPYLFATANETGCMASAIAWQLTGDKKYAENVAIFLRRWSDPQSGYPKTFRACNQSFVQEGHFTQHLAMSYDMILDSSVLSTSDINQINLSLRLVMQTFDLGNNGGAINNWNLSELTGAFYCALVLQDLAAADHFFAGPSGIKNQLAKGAMDDGWWYECSVSYNTWCTSEFSQAAIAYQPWGINFKDMQIPASYSQDAGLSSRSDKSGDKSAAGNPDGGKNINEQERPFGMCKEVWGPHTKPYRQIRDMWDSLPPFLDYRGVMFGINDSTEKRPADQDQAFDLAYYLYRDPVYAAVAEKAQKRSLLYDIGDPPDNPPEKAVDVSSLSAYADNAGVAMLRSQTADRPQSEQIQAVLHYGTHGWAHGHFDRTDLLSLMRYGRSFYSPEMVWYSYEPFMYKFYVQTSVNHNMVVVDQKMQEPVESKRLLFYTGKAFQATAVQTDAPWSNPPYGGMVYDYVPVKTFAEKCWREGRSVPVPAKPPTYGSLTDYTEPVLQRRLMIVTDDYVILADYLKAKEKHVFDNLLQLTGFQGMDAPGKTFMRHDPQWNSDPVTSAQFVTDCDWYSVQAPARAHFQMYWKSDPDPKKSIAPTQCSEDGILNMDVLSLWPPSQQIMIGQSPQNQSNEKKLWYKVTGDGKVLDQGQFGSWILGQATIDLPIAGMRELDLETKVEGSKKNTLFWANARVVTASGEEIPLSKLPVNYENIVQPSSPNVDYYGGAIKIVGTQYSEAIPAEPQDGKVAGIAHVDLSHLQATRFKAVVGGSFPLGNQAQLRKTYSIRSEGTEAHFLTLIEPYDKQSVVKSAQASGASAFRVELTDGRTQEITVDNLEGTGTDIRVNMKETKNGQEVRSESSTALRQ